ncbi:DUF2147 domain-containing protein [Marinibacterium profundimaris]|uniref:Imidazoleglycerol-phosphate dehydratase n=1 Tax=Marinibacterium profundimaris TaxID=1679460 RepID=A0A225NDA2_9RHOB|nr:DUF2147 domain-containing protein [Marinibacterium profundimaris]OWU69847.1 imidazoleglycerol-phosphate dehydratase [Marinibacterium profundimaris]
MRSRTLAKALLALSWILAPGLLAADPVEGTWKTGEGEDGGYAHVSIAPCGDAFCGSISAAYEPGGRESKTYPHLGRQLIWDMRAEGGNRYGGGQIWAPDTGKTYLSKMELKGETLTVKGCVAGGLLCRGQDWTRVD